MNAEMLMGIMLVAISGFAISGSAWAIKPMRAFRYEHWGFIAMLAGLVVTPWLVTLLCCPDAIDGYRAVGWRVLLLSNLFSLSWGIANVLYMMCLERIGLSLTNGILSGIGASLGVVIPMIFKGTGTFSNAPGLGSTAGLTVLLGVAVMLVGVVLVSLAGIRRDQTRGAGADVKSGGSFMVSLCMIIVAGVLSTGISFSFVYSQAPIVDAMKLRGASDMAANVAVWAAGLAAGAALNVLYPAWLMFRRRSFGVLLANRREVLLALIFGVTFFAGFPIMGKGMLLLGALGASVGFGLQQASLLLGGQVVGFLSGEWRGIKGSPVRTMLLAIALLLLAAGLMATGNFLHGG
jgi:L-rhamnose-H+ transport protein